jgi:hypothetical protein
MKRIIFILLVIALIDSCKKDTYNIPKDSSGDAELTSNSSASSAGITTLDGSFTVTGTFPNAKSGDVMNVELLKLQTTATSTTTQLLPLSGSQKTATVSSDLTASITYTRSEAGLSESGDYVVVSFKGETDYVQKTVSMADATTVSGPAVSGTSIDIARTSEVAYFTATVDPSADSFSGNFVVKRKNGTSDSWQTVTTSGTNPYLIPISGSEFATGKDTMFYTFTATQGSYTDEIAETIIVRDPYFFYKRSATLTVGSTDAENLLKNTSIASTDANATIAASSSLILGGGSAWLAAGHTIQFVPTTAAMYTENNSNNAIAAFNAGTPTSTISPIEGTGVFIFKIVNGTADSDVYYGMIEVTSVVPGTSVTFEYRIGNQYAHLSVIE